MTEITYIEPTEGLYAPLWWHHKGLSQTASGYGRKLTTPFKVKHDGRWYRVYVCQFSNAGTAYIVQRGEWRVIPDYAMPTIQERTP